MKAFASWGRYYDWTRYEIARGSFGGDLWHIYYRSLDTLDIGSLNLSNMPGQDLWGSATGFRDLRATAINNTDPNIKPMFQDSFNGGVDFQLGGNMALGIHYIHNNLGRTIEDMGALVNGDSVYVIGNPGEGQNTITPASYPRDRQLRDAEAEAAVRCARGDTRAAVLEELVRQRELHAAAGCTATTPARPTPTRSRRRRPASRRRPRSSRRAASRVRAATRTSAGTSTRSCGIRTAISMSSAVWPPIGRTS